MCVGAGLRFDCFMAHPGSSERAAQGFKLSRHSVGIRAILHARGAREQRIQIVEYSSHGLRLKHASGIEPDDHVTIKLGSGLRLPMRVVWVSGSSAAVRFLALIEPDHAVMRELDEEAAMTTPTPHRASSND
jgi:hypothetical protein